MTGGLMVIVAHPDDEVLLAGGALAACAAAGLPTSVVCLTEGEQGPIADPRLATPPTLGAVRRRELAAACAELGVGWLKCYRRPDGNLAFCGDRSGLVEQLRRVVAARRPDAVITFGEDGLYWHPDHVATFSLVRRALARVAEPPALYRSVWPQGLMRELVDELCARGLPADLWELEPEDFGAEDEDRAGELALDVRPFAVRKLRALRRHRSQLGADHAFAALPDDLAERYLGIERFVPVPAASGAASDWLERFSAAELLHA
jgi:N-acetyl-1-D-myo-inositol-2-amino-2-deoxy-alpha-D-glucopyranoside deacetylase